MTITAWIVVAAVAIVVIHVLAGVRVVRPTSRGLVERLYLVTEVMVNAERQEIITSDKLDARVDAQLYFNPNVA